MSMVDDISVELTNSGFGPVHMAYVPPGNFATVVFPSGGIAPEHTIANLDCVIDQPQCQILIRRPNFENGMQVCENIKKLLDGRTNTIINGTKYLSISIIGDVNYIGVVQTNKGAETREFTLNFASKIQRS